MLVARRDPFHAGAQDASPPPHGAGQRAPRSARAMLALQLTGSLLAIPVGLASAYSIYRANFSVETACQSLRANIISMIDKKIDAGTRRMLVRRDVEAFETTCGGFDPDAEAAFKALLASGPKTAALPAVTVPSPQAEPDVKEPVRKVEPRPAATRKPAAPTPAAAAAAAPEPAQREAATSDARWLAAVREALVDREPAPAAAATPQPAPVVAAQPPAAPKAPAISSDVSPDVSPALAPALPPPSQVAAPSAPAPEAARDHPVPPASIPGADPAPADVAKADTSGSSRFGWMSRVPILGPVLNN